MLPLVDVHSHVVPRSFPDAPDPASAARWPCMRCTGATTGTVMMGGKPFRDLDERSWNLTRRVEDMDRDGVAVQILSPMPELLSYWLEPAAARIVCEHGNAQIAEMVASAPGRFRGLGTVPLQDPALAARMLSRMRDEFGLCGVEIGSNINGLMLGDSVFEPFWEAAESLWLAVFVHALHPVATKAITATPHFTAFCGFPIDVGMAAASLITSGVLTRYPRLRIAFSHGGGALSAILGRLDKGWQLSQAYGIAGMDTPSAQARRLFFDSNVYDLAQLTHIATHMAPGRIMAGTDYPYAIMQENPASFIAASGLDAEQIDSLRFRAACDFVGETLA